MSVLIGKLAAKFLLPALGLKELVDLIQQADSDIKTGNLDSQNVRDLDSLTRESGVNRFAVVDFKTNSVIKFMSTRKMLLCTTPKRRVGRARKKEVVIVNSGQACPPQIIK